jgi:hypothetical protein
MVFIPMGRPRQPGDPPPPPLSRVAMYALVFLAAGLAIGAAFYFAWRV